MNKVVVIRAANGGGKTTLMRELMFEMEIVTQCKVNGIETDVFRNSVNETVCVLGGYPKNVASGGLDRVKDVKDVTAACVELAPHAHIMMEGMIYSALQARAKEVEEAVRPWATVYNVFLELTFEQHVENILKRRHAAGNMAPFDPEKTIRSKYRANEIAHGKFIEWGMNVAKLPYDDAKGCIKRLLRIGV